MKVLLAALLASLAAPAGHAVYKSLDRGRTWTRSDAGLPGTARINVFAALGGVVFAGTDGGIFVSGDEGRSWRATSLKERVISMAAFGGGVFAGTDGGAMVTSADGGRTWRREAGWAGGRVRSLLVSGGGLYAGTEKDGVFMSGDGGRMWTGLTGGLPRQAQVFSLAAVEGRVFAGLYAKGLYWWDGRAWKQAGVVTPLALAATGGTLLAGHNPGGTYSSADLGARWEAGAGEMPKNAPVWEMGAGYGLAVAGAADGIFISEDLGRTWLRVRQGAPGISFLVTERFLLAGVLTR